MCVYVCVFVELVQYHPTQTMDILVRAIVHVHTCHTYMHTHAHISAYTHTHTHLYTDIHTHAARQESKQKGKNPHTEIILQSHTMDLIRRDALCQCVIAQSIRNSDLAQ